MLNRTKRVWIILLVILLVFAVIVGFAAYSYFSVDRSGRLTGDGLFFQGEYYEICVFQFTGEGKTIGVADSWKINEIPEDPDHNFLGLRSFLDNFYVAKKTYKIPESGKINVVYIDHERYDGAEFGDAVKFLKNGGITGSFDFKTNNIEHYVKRVYVGYEDCPVGTEYLGMVGYIENKFVFIKPTKTIYKENGAREDQTYTCYPVPKQYERVFEKFPYYIQWAD